MNELAYYTEQLDKREGTMSHDPLFDEHRCRICGCTDDDACLDPETGELCYWVEEDLCSVCQGATP